MNTETLIAAFDTESAVYGAVAETLGASRITCANASILAAKIAAIPKAAGILPVVVAGGAVVAVSDFDDETALPEAGGAGYILSTIGTRGIESADGKKRNGITGLAVYPAHDVESILAHSSGAAYLLDLVEKEQGLVAFRGLRLDPESDTVADMAAAAAAMPTGLDDFLVRTRQGAASPYAVFNDNWSDFLKVLRTKNAISKDLSKALPPKKEMLNCIRSESYARQHFAFLEDAPGGSVFVKLATAFASAIAAMQAQAAEAGTEADVTGDPAQVTAWLEARDTVEIGAGEVKADALTMDLSAFGL